MAKARRKMPAVLAALVVAMLALGGVVAAQHEGTALSHTTRAQLSSLGDEPIKAQPAERARNLTRASDTFPTEAATAATGISGTWTLAYDFGCGGSYDRTPMTVNSDGTFVLPKQELAGLWYKKAGMFMFTFDASETTYAGNRAGESITGIMTQFGEPGGGCFFMRQTDGPTTSAVEHAAGKRDAAGNK
jgi:hypothetical protein